MTRDDALAVFQSVAKKHGREVEIDSTSDHSLQCHLAPVDGLQYQIGFAWFDDEVVLYTDVFTMEFYQGGEHGVLDDVQDTLDEILSNEVQMLFFLRSSAEHPYKVKLQRQENAVWKTFFTYSSGWPWSLTSRQEPKSFFDNESDSRLS